MKKTKRRLFTGLLCVVMFMAEVMSTVIPASAVNLPVDQGSGMGENNEDKDGKKSSSGEDLELDSKDDDVTNADIEVGTDLEDSSGNGLEDAKDGDGSDEGNYNENGNAEKVDKDGAGESCNGENESVNANEDLIGNAEERLELMTSADDIASGTYENIAWVIDANGKLTVEGAGEFAGEFPTNGGYRYQRAPWYTYRTSIISAEINVIEMTNASAMFCRCSNLISLDLNNFDTSGITEMDIMFEECSSLTSLDLHNFDTSKVTSMWWMFYGCSNLININLSSFDTSKITDMGSMFYGCSNLVSLDLSNFDTSKVTSMCQMFYECSSLTSLDLSNFNTSKVTEMGSMFYGCSNLVNLNLSSFDTSQVTGFFGMRELFMDCRNLTSLDLSNFNTSIATDMGGMFCGCSSLTSLDLSNFNTSNVTDMGGMFYGCSSLISIDLSSFDTSEVTNMMGIFEKCSSLISLDLSNFDMSKVSAYSGTIMDMNLSTEKMLEGCNGCKIINTPKNINVSIKLPSDGTNIWYCSDGTVVTELPQSLSYSVSIGKNYIPNELTVPNSGKLFVTMQYDGDTYDLLKEKQVLNVASDKKVTISIEIDVEKDNIDKYTLMQNDKNILENNTGIFTDISPQDLFEVEQSIYAVLYDSNNEEVIRRKLTLTISYHLQNRMTLSTETIRLTVYQNKKDSTSEIDKYETAKNVEISCNNACYITDENGIASIPSVFSGTVTIEKEDYITRTLTKAQLEESTSIYLQKKPNGSPVVYAVWIGNVDVLSHSYAINKLSTSSTTLTAEVDWGDSSMGSIKLVQDARTVQFASNSLTTILSDNFDTNEKIYILATDANGKYTKKALSIQNGTVSKLVNSLNGAKLDIGSNLKATLPDDFNPEFLKNTTFGVELPSSAPIPITVSVDDGKIYAVFGLDIFNYKHTAEKEKDSETGNNVKHTVNEYKTFINDFKNAAKTPSKAWGEMKKKYKNALEKKKGKFVVEADLAVMGFAEGQYDEAGNIKWLDSGIIINPSVSVKKDFPFTLPVGPIPVPMYFSTSFSVDVTAQGNIVLNDTSKNFTPDIDISGDVVLSGGIGVGVKKVLYAGGGLEGKLNADWRIYYEDPDHFTLKATLNAYAEAGILFFDGKKSFDPIYEEVWIDIPSGKDSSNSLNSIDLLDLYDTTSYGIKDLSYLSGNSNFTANEAGCVSYSIDGKAQDVSISAFKSNIYKESTPEYISFDDGRCMAVWIDSIDGNANNLCLYYSYYDGTVWSEPALILDDGTVDYTPCITKVNDTVCIAWQNATKTFMISDDLKVYDIAQDFDISVAIFDTDERTFKSNTIECDNLDMLPAICSNDDGDIYVAWINNGGNDWFGNNQLNSIFYSHYDSDSWSAPVVAYNNLYSIGSVAVDYNGELHIAYSLDTDGDLNTTDDIRVYENNQRVSSGDVYEGSPVYFNHELYWYTQNNIVNRRMYAEAGNITSESYRIVELNGEIAVIYPEYNGLYSTIMIAYLNKDVDSWGDAKALTSGDSFIGAFSAAVSGGRFELLLNSREVIGEITDDEPYGAAALILISQNQCCNLKLGEISFVESSYCVNESMWFTFNLTNMGTQTINSTKVEIIDDKGTILSSTDIYDTIVPGDTIEASVSFIVETSASEKNIRIAAMPNILSDDDLSDNTQDVVLGYEDISVENITYGEREDGKISISADIVNRGYAERSEVEVSLIKNSINGTVIDTRQIDTIDSMDLETVSFVIEADELGVYYVVVTEGDNKYTGNNSDFVNVSINDDLEHGGDDEEGDKSSDKDTYTVTFNTQNDTVAPEPYENVTAGSTILQPVAPNKNGYIFTGWFKEASCENKWDFDMDTVQGNLTLYAGWKVDDSANSPDNDGNIDNSDTVLPGDIPADGIPDTFWVAGIDSTGYQYTGKPIKPTVRVYDGNKRLKAGQDYTLSYKNNIAANDASNTAKAPTIIVKGKGNYGGKETVTFKILPIDLNDTSVTTEDIVVANDGKLQKKVPTLTYNGKKLSSKKDFTVSYPALDEGIEDAYKAVGTYDILLKAREGGNFSGSRTVKLTITDSILISKAKVSKISSQYYLGTAMEPYFTVTYNDATLVENEDYTFKYENNIAPGKAAIILTGIGDYAGTKKVYFTIKGPAFKNVTVDGIENKVYNGSKQEQQVYVSLDNIRLTEGVDYKVEYSNNQNAGKATITIKGINAYSGTAKKTFKITAYDIKTNELNELSGFENEIIAKYAKGGAKPKPTPALTFAGKQLVEGKDYTITYKNNKAMTTDETQNLPTIIIKGKGNFKGTLSKTFTIISKALYDEEAPVTLAVADKGFVNKAGNYISNPTLTDIDGKKLNAGIDYEKEIIYSLEDGTPLTNESIVETGTNIKVKVFGMGAYYGELEKTYRITENDFSKAKVKITPKVYTGSPITLNKDDINVRIGENTLTYGADYEVIEDSYTNNKNKGTASVTIIGKGSYGGMKISKFKITSKGFVWFWRML